MVSSHLAEASTARGIFREGKSRHRLAGDSATGDFHTHFKHLFFLDPDHAWHPLSCAHPPPPPRSLCARLPFPVPLRRPSHAAKAQSVPHPGRGPGVLRMPGKGGRKRGAPFACSAHPTACGARLLQLSRDALHPAHVHLWGVVGCRSGARGSPGSGACTGGSGTGAHSLCRAAAVAGRERRTGCRRGSGRPGALWALSGDRRRGRAGRGVGGRPRRKAEARFPDTRRARTPLPPLP